VVCEDVPKAVRGGGGAGRHPHLTFGAVSRCSHCLHRALSRLRDERTGRRFPTGSTVAALSECTGFVPSDESVPRHLAFTRTPARRERRINPDVHSILLDILGVAIVTIFAIHHGRGSVMFVAQPRVFFSTAPVILFVRLRCTVIRGAKDLLTFWPAEFRIENASLYNHPFAEVASRKHEVLHRFIVPLRSACRAGRGICRWFSVLGCSSQVVICRVPFVSFSHATGKVKSEQLPFAELSTTHFFATEMLANPADISRGDNNMLCRSSITFISFGARYAFIPGFVCTC